MNSIQYGSLDEEVIRKLRGIVGDQWVISDKSAIESYLYDQTPKGVRPKASRNVVVVKPRTSEEVSKILRLANEMLIPVYPRGGGTGLSGGCIPTLGGIILSLERMDNIIIDKENLMAITEAGVTLGKLIEEVEKANLSFPLHPGDEGAFIGGMVATNAGGARALKTGVMRNVILGMEVVLPTGEILKLGGKLIKNNMGYNLMHLIIGSEGTLGIITKVILRLFPRYEHTATAIIPFDTRSKALEFVPRMLQEGLWPLMVEYADRELLEKSAAHLGLEWPCKVGEAIVLVTFSEVSEEAIFTCLEKLDNLASKLGAHEPYLATRKDEQARILKIRSEIYNVLKPDTYELLDVSVPPTSMAKLIDKIDRIAERYGVKIPVYGHAADGNLHAHITFTSSRMEICEEIRDEIYEITIKLGGSITGEHGVGATRVKYLRKYFSDKQLRLLWSIKRVFDPNNILNPGKVLPELKP